MAIPQSASILYHLRQTVLRRDGAGLTDGQLLRSFLHHRDEAAFEALVRRHGPMVRGVCHRILRNSHDADDAFQAAFLVLLRKASTLVMREVVGDWLHGVAYRTALKARSAAARRRLKERQTSRSEAIFTEGSQSEWRPLLDQEIGRLPEKYRTPLVLCDLEGRTRKEAAQQLGWPEGTLSGRLSRARAMLARRLTRKGITLSAGALTVGLASEASARVPFSLVGSTCKAAMSFAAGSAAGSVPAHVAALTEGVVKAMLLSKLKKVVGLGMISLVLMAGAGAWRYAAVAGEAEKQTERTAAPTARRVGTEEVIRPPVSLPKSRQFQFDFRIEQEKNGQRKLLGGPTLMTLEGEAAGFSLGQEYPVPLGNNQVETVVMGPAVQLVARSDVGDRIRLDMTISKPTQGSFGKGETIVETKSIRVIRQVKLGEPIAAKLKTGEKEPTLLEVTAAVRLMQKEIDPNTIAAAEKDLKMASSIAKRGIPIRRASTTS